jgi:hypothetical protein
MDGMDTHDTQESALAPEPTLAELLGTRGPNQVPSRHLVRKNVLNFRKIIMIQALIF